MQTCCKESEIKIFKNLIAIPSGSVMHYYNVEIVYCKNCGQEKSNSHVKYSNTCDPKAIHNK